MFSFKHRTETKGILNYPFLPYDKRQRENINQLKMTKIY